MNVSIRPLRDADLDDADRIFRLAFGTFIGLPDPREFAGDSDWIRTRWRGSPESALAAESDGRLVGSNFAARWGSFGFFGPLTVRPDAWDRGIAKRLLGPTMDLFAKWGVTHRGLFTFPHSAKHHALYQKFGFYPRFLTVVLEKPVNAEGKARVERLSAFAESERGGRLAALRDVADSLYDGLDVGPEIVSVATQGLGDTVMLVDGEVAGFAVCHVGKGSEAGSGRCYVKFGAVRCGPRAPANFERLLDACESYAAAAGASTLVAGVNLAREPAYRSMLARGFRVAIVGVAMQSGNEPGFNRPEVFAIDDWR